MISVKGAISVEENTAIAIEKATIELMNELFEKNSLKKENISHIFFTLTKDLNADFPAKFARINFGLNEIPLMCHQELDVPNALGKILRILIVAEGNQKPVHVYLKEAKKLRPDLT